MSCEAVLIAAFSGRALAQSARRAGYVPLVVDAFGDLDTREAAADLRVIDGAIETGFKTKPLIAALDELAAAASSPPIGLVLGSGFEDKPGLWDALDTRYSVLGCKADTVRKCKDPRIFFPLLDELGIPHPEWRMDAPECPNGWLTKRSGGSGGRHIRFAGANSRGKPRRYFQRRLEGNRVSVNAVVGLGIGSDSSRQWCAPSLQQPFRYGGAVSLPFSNQPAELEMVVIVDRLSRTLALRGVASFDFLVVGNAPYLLEVNPRPGASHDVHDDPSGWLFKAHISICRGADFYWDREARSGIRAAAILHADRGPLALGDIPWPDWSADRGAPGTFIPSGAPLATAFAEAETAEAAERLVRTRLVELEALILSHSTPQRAKA